MLSAPFAIDRELLSDNGYSILRELVEHAMLAEFEVSLDRFACGQLRQNGIARRREDALHDLMLDDGGYREALFPLLKYMPATKRLADHVEGLIRRSGFLAEHQFETPLIWHNLRVDLPGEETFLLPMHQDYASTKCHRAYRLWIPLRDANKAAGTLRLVEGSHKLGQLPHDEDGADMLGPSVRRGAYAGLPEKTIEIQAGDAVLFDPHIVHGSVRGTQEGLKFVLLVQVQDLSSLYLDGGDCRTEFADATARRVEQESSRSKLPETGALGSIEQET